MPYLSISLGDSYGRETRKLIELEEKPLLADYVTLVAAFATDLQAVTDLSLVRADLVITGVHAGFAVTAGANIDTGASFVGYLTGANGKKASLKLPGIKPALVSADGSVDIANVTVAEYLAYWVTGTPNDMLLSDGEEISAWISGRLDK